MKNDQEMKLQEMNNLNYTSLLKINSLENINKN